MLMAYWINFSESFILRRFAWGCTGGAITGTQNFLKDCLTVIKASDPQQGLPLVFYPLFVLAGTTAFVGLLFLTACMKRYDATYSAASFVGSFVVSASIMAAVHYDTFAQLNGLLNYVLYPFGIIVLMIGVYLLVKESSGSSQEVYSIDTERQPDANNDEEVNFNSQVRALDSERCVLSPDITVVQRQILQHYLTSCRLISPRKDMFQYTEVEDEASEDLIL